MSDVRLARVGDVIAHGETIPANVVRMLDRHAVDEHHGVWVRVGTDPLRFIYRDGKPDGHPWEAAWLQDRRPSWFPFTVVEVDPGLQPADPVEISQHCNGCGNWMPPPAVHKATCPIPPAVERLLTGDPAESGPLVLTLPEAVAALEMLAQAAEQYLTAEADDATRATLRLTLGERVTDTWLLLRPTPPREPDLPELLGQFEAHVMIGADSREEIAALRAEILRRFGGVREVLT